MADVTPVGGVAISYAASNSGSGTLLTAGVSSHTPGSLHVVTASFHADSVDPGAVMSITPNGGSAFSLVERRFDRGPSAEALVTYVWQRTLTGSEPTGGTTIATVNYTSPLTVLVAVLSQFYAGAVPISRPAVWAFRNTVGATFGLRDVQSGTVTSRRPGSRALFIGLHRDSSFGSSETVGWSSGVTARQTMVTGSVFNTSLADSGLLGVGSSSSAAFFENGSDPAPRFVAVGAYLLEPANSAPAAPILLTPASNEALNRDASNRFSWAHSDPDLDGQSAYDLRYRLVGAASWTTVNGSTPNQFRDVAAGTFAAGSYEWQVRTYDTAGFVGPYSASGFFSAASLPPGPSITAPINGATIGQASVTVTWTATDQDAYQVRSVADAAGAADTATVYYDTGEIVSASVRSVTVPLPTNSRYEHLQVRIKDNGLFSPWTSVRVLVSYTLPAVALLSVEPVQTVASTYSFTDANAVTIVSPAPTGGQPAVSYRNVWCKATTDGDPYRPKDVPVRIATFVPSGVYLDEAPASGVDYIYAVEQVATNGTASMSDYVGDVRDFGQPDTGGDEGDFADAEFAVADFD